MLQHSGRIVLLVLLIGGGGVEAGRAQEGASVSVPGDRSFCEETVTGRSLDVKGLAGVYCLEAPVVTGVLQAAHVSARPVFFGAVPAAWLRAGILRSHDAVVEAYALSLSQGITYGVVVGLKRAVRRPRPYVRRPLASREKRYGAEKSRGAYLSFPSGHAGLSAAIVTSWSLSHPRWYVIGPGSVWATAVGLSRLYQGLHYPSDVLAGTLLGVGMAVLVDHFREELTPPALEVSSQAEKAVAIPVGVRIRF